MRLISILLMTYLALGGLKLPQTSHIHHDISADQRLQAGIDVLAVEDSFRHLEIVKNVIFDDKLPNLARDFDLSILIIIIDHFLGPVFRPSPQATPRAPPFN